MSRITILILFIIHQENDRKMVEVETDFPNCVYQEKRADNSKQTYFNFITSIASKKMVMVLESRIVEYEEFAPGGPI